MGSSPMFPLGSVLVPGQLLPLHVFEPRYRALVEHCSAAPDPDFGVVLIARGHEVGGGDERTNVGTMARIVRAARFPDGRYALEAVGTYRIRVLAWFADDPYPQALVEPWPDDPCDAGALPGAVAAAHAALVRVLALAAKAGMATAPATVDLPADPVAAVWGMVSAGPLGPADRQHLLALPDALTRAVALRDALDGAAEVVRFHLG